MMICFTRVENQALATVFFLERQRVRLELQLVPTVIKPLAYKSPRNLQYNRGPPRSRASKASLPPNRSVQSPCKSGEVASFSIKERTYSKGPIRLVRAATRPRARREESRVSSGHVVDITKILARNLSDRVLDRHAHKALWQ